LKAEWNRVLEGKRAGFSRLLKGGSAMNRVTSSWTAIAWFFVGIVFLTAALVVFQAAPAFANERQEARQLVEKSRLTLNSFMNDDNMGAFRDLLKKAEGVLISPQLLKGAFVVGVSGGNAVFLARDKKTGEWSEPAFYTIGGASFGLQIGGEASEVILLAMTDRGVRSLLANSVKLGGDVGVAAGPVGIGAAAATANLSADILSFSRSKGLYAGISLDGAVVAVRGALNDAYYGKKGLSPTDILVHHNVVNPQAAALIADLSRSAARKSPSMG
jgi:SH3 domain-containing YSC84-like protein 1